MVMEVALKRFDCEGLKSKEYSQGRKPDQGGENIIVIMILFSFFLFFLFTLHYTQSVHVQFKKIFFNLTYKGLLKSS